LLRARFPLSLGNVAQLGTQEFHLSLRLLKLPHQPEEKVPVAFSVELPARLTSRHVAAFRFIKFHGVIIHNPFVAVNTNLKYSLVMPLYNLARPPVNSLYRKESVNY
jgi:hypothetical protein